MKSKYKHTPKRLLISIQNMCTRIEDGYVKDEYIQRLLWKASTEIQRLNAIIREVENEK